MTTDQRIQLITFSGGVVSLVGAFLVALPNLDDNAKLIVGAAVTLLVGVANLALGVFFKVTKPITTARNAAK